jgi:hypothetical protein
MGWTGKIWFLISSLLSSYFSSASQATGFSTCPVWWLLCWVLSNSNVLFGGDPRHDPDLVICLEIHQLCRKSTSHLNSLFRELFLGREFSSLSRRSNAAICGHEPRHHRAARGILCKQAWLLLTKVFIYAQSTTASVQRGQISAHGQ